MVYCTKEEVRNLTGLTDLELDDSQLEEIILNAERQVNFETAKLEGWDTSDPKYPLIQTAAKFYAAALCYETFPDDKAENFGEKAERFRNEATKILRSFRSPIVKSSSYEHIEE